MAADTKQDVSKCCGADRADLLDEADPQSYSGAPTRRGPGDLGAATDRGGSRSRPQENHGIGNSTEKDPRLSRAQVEKRKRCEAYPTGWSRCCAAGRGQGVRRFQTSWACSRRRLRRALAEQRVRGQGSGKWEDRGATRFERLERDGG